jgi:hypothetical protein
MGSWNGTCALTQLPICEGEPVVAFILELHDGTRGDCGSGFIHATHLAHPLGPALLASYNGYGGIESLDGPALPWWRTRLAELGPTLMTQDNDEPDEGQLTDLETLVNEGIVAAGLYRGPAHARCSLDFTPSDRLGLMLVHRGAYDAFMQATLSSPDWILDEYPGPVEMYRAKLLELQPMVQAVADATACGMVHADIDKFIGLRTAMFRALEPMKVFDSDSADVYGSAFAFIARHPDSALLDELARTQVFALSLEIARKCWSLQCGKGSGNDDASLQLALARYMLASST